MLLGVNQSYLLWNAEICPSKPLCRVSPKFQSRRSATELFTVSRSALVLRLLHSIAVSLLLHCHAMLRARGVPLDLCGPQLCRALSLVPGARPLLRRRLGGNCTVALASSSPCEPAIFITKVSISRYLFAEILFIASAYDQWLMHRASTICWSKLDISTAASDSSAT